MAIVLFLIQSMNESFEQHSATFLKLLHCQHTEFSNATMPRVPEPKSLVKLCVNCVTSAVKSSKSATDLPAVMRHCSLTTVNSKFISNPFHQLPVELLEEIIFSFTKSYGRLVHQNFLHYLITPQIQHLSFSNYYVGHLGLFPKLGNLLTLDLGKTRVKDDSLKSIGIYCSQLRSLNLKGCTHVTDDGIRWLCGEDFPGMGKSKLCKTIQKLSILHTSVTKKGIQVALENFLFLNILENCYIVDALAELAQSAIDFKQPGFYNNTFSISTLYTSPDTPFRSNSLPLALTLCHLVNQVSICVTDELKDSDLLCLLSIKMLRKLEIGGSSLRLTGETSITFDGGVAPLLKVFGRSLETLMLEGVKLVRVSSIIDFCPNLITLCISGASGSFKDEDLFQVPADILLVLLSFPSLEKISINRCDSLTDEVLLETFKSHRFKHLKKLELGICDSVTRRCIRALLLNGCDSLEVMSLHWCKCLGQNTLEYLRSLIAKKNWNLYVSYKFSFQIN